MMDILNHLGQGFAVALTPSTWCGWCWAPPWGRCWAWRPGPLHGDRPAPALTFGMRPDTALIAMCAIYYGAMFGGSRSSILLNVPGDGVAVASCFDGYPMARKGRAGAALAVRHRLFIGGLTLLVLALVSTYRCN